MSGKHRDRPGLIPGLVFVASSQYGRDQGIVIRLDETGQRCIEIGRSPRPARHVSPDTDWLEFETL